MSELATELVIASLIDAYHAIQQERLALAKQLSQLEAAEKYQKTLLIDALQRAELTGASSPISGYYAGLVEKQVPTLKDWGAFTQFIREQDAFELVQRRPSEAAVRDYWDNGQAVPGVDAFTVTTLTMRKMHL